MAWNIVKKHNVSKKHANVVKCFCSLKNILICVLIGLIILLAIIYKGGKDTVENSVNQKLKNVELKDVQTRGVIHVDHQITHTKQKTKKLEFWEVPPSMTNGFTSVMQRKWEHKRRIKLPPIPTGEIPKSRYEIFTHQSENEIACLLSIDPGTTLIGTPNYRHITADFLKSCSDPIIINKEDDEFTRQLKENMVKIKSDLKPRIDAGEDLGNILLETRKEYQQLAKYKQVLKENTHAILKTSDSPNDIDTIISAANMMLAEKGIAPMKLGTITRHKFLQIIKNNQKKGKK